MASRLLARGDTEVPGPNARDRPAINVTHRSPRTLKAMRTKDHESETVTAEGAESAEGQRGHVLEPHISHTRATRMIFVIQCLLVQPGTSTVNIPAKYKCIVQQRRTAQPMPGGGSTVPYETPEDSTLRRLHAAEALFHAYSLIFLDDPTSRSACSRVTRHAPAANKREHVAADELDVVMEAYASRESVIVL